ncbi:MAG: hypothetical protein M3R17_18265, partial [Bacteroidota bacterium]|nr:hypothetical protein [Bacteroidota bacterium]
TIAFTFFKILFGYAFSTGISELLNNITIGIYSSILLIVTERFLRALRLYKALQPMTGRWFEYCRNKNDEKKFIFTGIATISYVDENELSIILETLQDAPNYDGHKKYNVHDEWRGTIQLNEQQLSSGKISYSYKNTFPNFFSYGFKDFSYNFDSTDSFILLTEIALPGKNGFDYSLLKRKFEQV